MQLRDPETLQFEVVNNFPIRKSKTQKDIALVLVGYGGDTYYPTTESFSGVAEKSIDYLSKLSFGEVSTYELFDGGIVEESGVSFLLCKTLGASIASWPPLKVLALKKSRFWNR